MKFNWKYFCAAALVVGAALVKNGVPWISVAAGILGVAAIGAYQYRRAG